MAKWVIVSIIAGCLFIIIPVKATTYYLGTSPTSSFNYSIWNGYVSPILFVSTSTKTYADATTDCVNKGGRLAEFADYMYWIDQKNTQLICGDFTNGQNYLTNLDNSATAGYYLKFNVTCTTGTNYNWSFSFSNYQKSSQAHYYMCATITSSAFSTVTGTYYGWSDTLSIQTASSSGGGGSSMTPEQIKIFVALGIIISILLGLDFGRRYFAKPK